VLRAGPTEVLPAYVTAEAGSVDAPRTLVLRPPTGKGTAIQYALLRDRGPQLGDADLPPDSAQVALVDGVVAQLAAGVGQQAAVALAHAGIGYVLVPSTSDGGLNAEIAAAGGLQQQSSNADWRLWQVDTPAGLVAIAQDGRAGWTLPAGKVAVGAHAAPVQVPYAPATRSLVLAETPSPQWQAVAVPGSDDAAATTTAGTPLAATTLEGMQAFRLPASAVDVRIERLPDRRADWLVFELVVLAVAVIGAVPGGRRNQRSRRRAATTPEGEST
jgi:hypothetical protein